MGILCKLFVLEQFQNQPLLDKWLSFSFSVLVGLLSFLRRNSSCSQVIKVLGSLTDDLQDSLSNVCPIPVVVTSPVNLLEMQILRPLPRPMESGSLGWSLAVALKVVLMHAKVLDP